MDDRIETSTEVQSARSAIDAIGLRAVDRRRARKRRRWLRETERLHAAAGPYNERPRLVKAELVKN